MKIAVLASHSIGGPFLVVKWIDVYQGDEQRPEYRRRLMARELNFWDPTMSGTFVATPPLECLSIFMTEPADQYKSVANKVEQFEEHQAQTDNDRVILILDP